MFEITFTFDHVEINHGRIFLLQTSCAIPETVGVLDLKVTFNNRNIKQTIVKNSQCIVVDVI